jgi:hypothetical protein
MRPIDPADFFGAGMDVDEFDLGCRAGKQRIALRRDFAETAAGQHQQVSGFGARHQLRVGTETEVAGVERMQGIEQRRAAIAGCDRHPGSLGEFVNVTARGFGPAAAAEHE